jgi:rod shape-determining protein MreC
MGSDSRTGARRYWPVLIFLMLGTLAGAWHERATDHGRPDMVAGAVRTVVAPPAGLLARVSHWCGDQIGWITRGRTLADENRKLTQQAADLEQENARLREVDTENARMRADLNFAPKERPRRLGADVLERRTNPNFDTILISRGSRDGVRPHSVVVTRNGLVGQVWEVSPTTASVVLLTDPQYGSVGGRVQRANSRAEGVCRGDSAAITMIDLRIDADIKPGDQIVTSGYSIFPKGLLIGKVKEIKNEEGGVTKTAKLIPAVDFTRLEQVYVLLPANPDTH